MILHLGCGGRYLPKALNVDRYDLCVADVQADAVILPIRCGVCEAVVAYHVIEHLGYRGAVYALAEFFRVLKPGGALELETPDPEASFQAFLEQDDPLRRAQLLSWIFGTEVSGMGHEGLFPKELLKKLAAEAGFCSLNFSEPKTHRHGWGFRLSAKAGNDPSARLIAALRPSIVADILQKCTPQEALEIELRVWVPLSRLLRGELPTSDRENLLLELVVVAPEVILHWAKLSENNCTTAWPASSLKLQDLSRLADAFLKARLSSCLRYAFSVLCATVNQVPNGYFFLLTAAKKVAQKWLVSLPIKPEEEIETSFEACGLFLQPKAKLTYAGDFEASSGQIFLTGRRPKWPEHNLFTSQQFMERTQWFRDLGLKCFACGDLEQARRAFRLAINSKMQDFYSLWNMARLQAALGEKNNAELFYKAALSFPLRDEVKNRLLSELNACSAGKPISIGPVSVGEGQDRIFDFLEKSKTELITSKGGRQAKETRGLEHYPPPKTILWELTLKCQCRCTHCAASGGKPRPNELNTEEAFSVCDQIAELGIPSVCLMGGEALLRSDWEAISCRLSEHGLNLGLATNGIALDSETWPKLEKLGFSQIVVSLDGASAEVHDTRRHRKGALEAAQRAIKEMTLRHLKHRTVVTSVDKNNLGELEGIRDWLVENAPGITWMINFSSPTPGGRMEHNKTINQQEFLSLVKFIAENRVIYKNRLDLTATHGIGYFSQKYPDLYNYTWSGCEAGINTLGLKSDGNVTGCLILSDSFIEDNVRRRRLIDVWNDPKSFSYNRHFSENMLKGKCRSCRWGKICRGGCREASFSFTGDMFESPFCLYHLEKTNNRQAG